MQRKRLRLVGETGKPVNGTIWLPGPAPVITPVRFAQRQTTVRVVADETGCRTYSEDLALWLRRLIDYDLYGVFHACNDGPCTWCDFASAIVRAIGVNCSFVQITSEELGRPAKRPVYSVLDTTCLYQFAIKPRRWSEALMDVAQ